MHSGYLALPNVFMLVYIGSATIEARVAKGQLLADGLRDYGEGRVATNRIA